MRTLVSLLLAGLFVVAAAGCGQKPAAKPDATKAPAAPAAPAAPTAPAGEKPAEPAK